MPKTKRRLLPLSGLLSLCLLALLTGCATTQTEYVRDTPPAHLLEPCTVQKSGVSTNGELLDLVDKHRRALRACNDDKAALREWANQGKP